MRSIRASILVALGLAIGPLAAGGAGSGIVYTKDANVWVARPDGSGAVAITGGGTAASPYRSPTRDAAGRVAAERDGMIHRFTPTGAVLGTPFEVLDPGVTEATRQPLGLALSPNGSNIALFVFGTCLSRATSCPKTFITPAGGYVRSPDYNTSSAFPSWLDDDELVMANEPDAALYQALPQATGTPWFRDFTVFGDPGPGLQGYIDEVAVSPARDRVAVIRRVCGATPDTCRRSMEIMNVPGPIPATAPVPACRLEGGALASPTWSPTGTQIAVEREDGIAIADVTNMASGCGTVTFALAIPGGAAPEWGPADPPASTTPAKGTPAARAALKNATVRLSGRRARVTVTVTAAVRLTLVLRALTPRARVLDRLTRRFGKGSWAVNLDPLPPGRYELTARETGRTKRIVRRFTIR